jgi:hypothetical protein
MIRPLLTELVLFLVPFAIYAVFLLVTKNAVLDRASWPPKLIATLAIVALALMLGSFIYLSHFSGAPPGSTHVPAHLENGRLVPGEVR